MNTKEIISQGKLKTYYFGTSFLEVYWSHPQLGANQYYLFKFTALKLDFIDVSVINPKGLYRKHNPKYYVPIVERLMQDLQKQSI